MISLQKSALSVLGDEHNRGESEECLVNERKHLHEPIMSAFLTLLHTRWALAA